MSLSSSPYTALDPLSPSVFREVWLETVFNQLKLDPQIGDISVLADFPILLSQVTWQELSRLARQLASEAMAAETELLQRPDLHSVLGLPKAVCNSWRNPARVKIGTDQDIRLIRFDFHYTTEGWRISEANIDTPGGWIESSGFTRLMAENYPGMRLAGAPPFTLAHAIRARLPAGALVALIHATAYSDDRQMMVYLGRLLEAEGLRTCLVSPTQLIWKDGGASVSTNWLKAEIAYLMRYFPAEWLPNLPGSSRWRSFFNDCRIPATNPSSALLVQSKRFPLVWDQLSTPLPTWRELLPETRDPCRTNDSESNTWVMKPVLGRAGEDITIHGISNPKTWTATNREARRHHGEWIAQRHFEIVPVTSASASWYPCIGVYTVNGQVAGIYGRAATQPIINDTAKDIAVLIEN